MIFPTICITLISDLCMRAGTAAFATIPVCLETGSTCFRSVCSQCYVINHLEKALKMFSFGSQTWVTC